MGSRYEVEVKITSAKDLKNISWRYGKLKPYAVVWVDPKAKCSTKVDDDGDTNPYWNEKLVIPLTSPIEDSTLYIDVVHVKSSSDEDIKPLIGSAKLKLADVVDDVGIDSYAERTIDLKRPSGRPHGKIQVEVTVREPRYRAPDPYYAPPYGVPPPGSRDYPAPPQPYGGAYGAPAPYAAPPTGYPYGAAPQPYGQPNYGQPGYPQGGGYGQPAYAQGGGYGQPSQGSYGQQGGYGYVEEKKKSKFGGMGTGLAVGAVAGALGGIALVEGIDALEDNIAEKAAEKVEDDLADDYGGDYGDDDY